MNGIELSRAYYNEFGKPMLEARFPDLLALVAVGVCGSGSDCFGYDDEISRDHDFEPGFMIFLPGEDVVDRRTAFLLERAYDKLPKEFAGVRRQAVKPVGGARRGVFRTAEYFRDHVGTPDGILTLEEWLTVPDYARAEATNGEIFFDQNGEVTAIRRRLLDMPADARLKRLAGNLITMAQAGQYNYPRCLSHGESGAAQLALAEFVRASLAALFLLARRPMPFYKWSFRALRELGEADAAKKLEYLISSPNDNASRGVKTEAVDSLCSRVAEKIAADGIAPSDVELERLAYAVNAKIADPGVRNLSVFSAF